MLDLPMLLLQKVGPLNQPEPVWLTESKGFRLPLRQYALLLHAVAKQSAGSGVASFHQFEPVWRMLLNPMARAFPLKIKR